MFQKLRHFGLTAYEAQAYDALMRYGASTAHKLAKESRVPAGKIYPVLDVLSAKGFVQVSEGRPKIYAPAAPEIALGRFVEDRKKALALLTNGVRDIATAYAKMHPPSVIQTQDSVEVYTSKAASLARSEILHGSAVRYWKTMSALTVKKTHLDACKSSMKRGVVIRALTSLEETTPLRIAEWKRAGIDVRILDRLPFKASIYDDKGVVFRFSHEDTDDYVGVHIRNPRLARGMSSFFDRLWQNAKR